jgi:cupin fold WbuC family metalloprotein
MNCDPGGGDVGSGEDENSHGTPGVKHLGWPALESLVEEAGRSPRRRAHLNVHGSLDDPVQRLFVAVRLGSYFRPHRHRDKWEFAWVVRGSFALLVFDGTGRVTDRIVASASGAGDAGFELAPGLWHTYLALEDGSAFLEVKQGPYVPGSAYEFAPWAPAEGAPEVPGFLAALESARPGSVVA